MSKTIRIGTLGSKLGQWQAQYASNLIRQHYQDVTIESEIIATPDDAIHDSNEMRSFTLQLEEALRTKKIDCAIHNLDNLPTETGVGVFLRAIPERGNPFDAIVSREQLRLDELPQGATIGTNITCHKAQLLHFRPDLNIIDIHGSIPKRINILMTEDSPYDAIVLAVAELERLNRESLITENLSLPVMGSVPAQGAIAIQCREEPDDMSFFAPLMHLQTWLAVTAERAFLKALGGDMMLPISAYAYIEKSVLYLHGRVTAIDGSAQIDVKDKVGLIRESNIIASANRLGVDMAQHALDKGADVILEQSRV